MTSSEKVRYQVSFAHTSLAIRDSKYSGEEQEWDSDFQMHLSTASFSSCFSSP